MDERGRPFSDSGEETTAGRQALIVEWVSPAGAQEHRLWVDEQTGVVLRQQGVDQIISNRFQIYDNYEIIIRKIAFDVNLPGALFDPRQEWHGGFALDYNGWYDDPAQSNGAGWISIESR
jgi:hypothetical protein